MLKKCILISDSVSIAGNRWLQSGILCNARNVMKRKTVGCMKQFIELAVPGERVFISDLFICKRA